MRPALSMFAVVAAISLLACKGGELEGAATSNGAAGANATGGSGAGGAAAGAGGAAAGAGGAAAGAGGAAAGAGGATTALKACLDSPDQLDGPPTGALPCNLLPPGFGQ